MKLGDALVAVVPPLDGSITAAALELAVEVEDLLLADEEEIGELVKGAKKLAARRFVKWLEDERSARDPKVPPSEDLSSSKGVEEKGLEEMLETLVDEFVEATADGRLACRRVVELLDHKEEYARTAVEETCNKARKVGIVFAAVVKDDVALKTAREILESVLRRSAYAAVFLAGSIFQRCPRAELAVAAIVPQCLEALRNEPETTLRQLYAEYVFDTFAMWKKDAALGANVQFWEPQLLEFAPSLANRTCEESPASVPEKRESEESLNDEASPDPPREPSSPRVEEPQQRRGRSVDSSERRKRRDRRDENRRDAPSPVAKRSRTAPRPGEERVEPRDEVYTGVVSVDARASACFVLNDDASFRLPSLYADGEHPDEGSLVEYTVSWSQSQGLYRAHLVPRRDVPSKKAIGRRHPDVPRTERYVGRVKFTNRDRMFGALQRGTARRGTADEWPCTAPRGPEWPMDNESIFFHFSQVAEAGLDLREDAPVEFTIKHDPTSKKSPPYEATFLTTPRS